MITTLRVACCSLCALGVTSVAWGSVPWPAQTWGQGTDITAPQQSVNLSGAYYNAAGNYIFAIQQGNLVWKYTHNQTADAWVPGLPMVLPAVGDYEGITMFDENVDPNWGTSILVLNEGDGSGESDSYIYWYKSLLGVPILARSWKIGCAGCNMPGEVDNTAGPEGIAFVPNSWLAARGFVNRYGIPVQGTTRENGGMGGLVFVGHQTNGYIYVFNLRLSGGNNAFFIGAYDTGSSFDEIADLSFDNENGLLYILHGAGSNSIEVTDLTVMPGGQSGGVQTLSSLAWTTSADNGAGLNLEGLAVIPPKTCAAMSGCAANLTPQDYEGHLFVTCDGSADAFRWMRGMSVWWISPSLLSCTNLMPGDANCDGVLNGNDIQGIMTAVVTGSYSAVVDVNQDGAVTMDDVQSLISQLAKN